MKLISTHVVVASALAVLAVIVDLHHIQTSRSMRKYLFLPAKYQGYTQLTKNQLKNGTRKLHAGRTRDQRIFHVLPKIDKMRSIYLSSTKNTVVNLSISLCTSRSCGIDALVELASPSTELSCYQTQSPSTWLLAKLVPPYNSSNDPRLRRCYLKTFLSWINLNGQSLSSMHWKRTDRFDSASKIEWLSTFSDQVHIPFQR